MQIGFVINDINTEKEGYTTVRLAKEAINLFHKVWFIAVADFSYCAEGFIHAIARTHKKNNYKNSGLLLNELQGKDAKIEKIKVTDLDVLMLRNNPSDDIVTRPWAQTAGILFGRQIMKQGVIVLNDPNGLSKALNKMYFQEFPESVRPRTIITRDINEVKKFANEEKGNIVLKPLQGSGGQGVFLIRKNDTSNLNQIFEAISRDGYVTAQEYLSEAEKGDIRFFMINGKSFMYKGKYAAFRRVRAEGDIRSNITAGGSIEQAIVNDKILEIAEIVRPKLVKDGMFIVGLDIVGNKLMEINVFSPGGLGSAQEFEGVNFSRSVIRHIERKVEYMNYYKRNFDNLELNTL